MRRRFTRWIIQTAALWAAQMIARKIVEKMAGPDDRDVRKIAVEYERTGEERVGPGVAGTATAETSGGPASDSPSASGSPA
jgi:hypothetical protein